MAFLTTVTITPTNGGPYTWAGSGFSWTSSDGQKTWDTAYPVNYALNVGEGWSTSEAWDQLYTFAPHEGWHIAEAWSQAFLRAIGESWRINEVWTDIWQPMLRIFEVWLTTEALAKNTTIPKSESWATAEAATRAPQLNKSEGWHTSEAWLQQYLLHQLEGWNTAELAANIVSRVIQEGWSTADSLPIWTALKAFLEGWNNGETMTHIWQDFLTFVESWTTTETPAKAATKPVFEVWHTSEGSNRAATKGVAEGWHTSEAASTQAVFQRTFADVWQMVDSLSKTQIKTIFELLDLEEAYLRHANAVISDLSFATGDLTKDQFTGLVSSPVGYGPFTDFVPGELEYQKALIAIILAGPLTTGRPQIIDWQLTVDVPNQTDGGTLALPAANTFIPFKARFFAPPEVIIQLRGGSTGSPDITAITDTGFYVQINDATGHPIAGDIVWSAIGY